MASDNPTTAAWGLPTAKEWALAEIWRLHQFVDWWQAHQKKNPDHFPSAMEPGEWDEQYRCWHE